MSGDWILCEVTVGWVGDRCKRGSSRYEHRYIVCSEPKQKASATVVRRGNKNMRSPHRSMLISVYSTWPSVAMANEERIMFLALCFRTGLDYSR